MTPSIRACLRRSLTGREFANPGVGGWRILFAVDREAKAVCIVSVDTRGQVYRHS